ncbi:MAG: catalase [Alphaproteobacteria bacterium]|nr:catalase [Alphaproteobacteria bacterium]
MRSSNDLTTESGAPVADNRNSQSAGPRGPLLLQDQHLIEKLARFNRERIPERVVHAVGSGAYGVFEVTNPDAARWTRMRMFAKAGKRTEVFARFSTFAGSRGAADTVRDPRGFAVKFYTEDGNWDLAGNNTPVFFIRDPLKFPDLIHSQKTDPHSNRQEADNAWDFFSHSPEATHQFTWLFGDRGLPRSWRHMNGYGSHTFQWINAAGERVWVKFHFKTDQGVKCLTAEEAARIAGEEPRHLQHDLYRAIERGDYPSWTLKVQVMPEIDAVEYRMDPFDLTKVWPHKDYPPMEVGRLTLNRLPDNYFAEVEQSAFDPGHMVPGVGPSPDKMLQARLFAYGDAHRYRLGVNHTRLPVNSPRGRLFAQGMNYGRDGAMRFDDNGGRSANYEPNSFGGPVGTGEPLYAGMETRGLSGSYGPEAREVDDFAQAGDLYRLMSEDEKDRLVAAIAESLSQVQRTEIGDAIVCRSLGHFCRADREYGRRVAVAVKARRGGVRTACFRAGEAAKDQS